MKRMDVNRQTLEAMYPPMDERFERNMRAMIDTLPARREKKRAAMKPRYALAFALLLALLAVTALAAYTVRKGFFAAVTQLESERGYYEHWTLEDKEKLLTSMKENHIIEDTAQWDAALAIEDEAKREKQLDELFTRRYGVGGRMDTITAEGIIEKETGAYDSKWSLEQKANYSAILLEFDLMGYDANIDLLPGEEDIPQEEAIRIAKAAVMDAYRLEAGALDDYEIHVYFWEHRTEIGVKPPYYLIEMMCPGQKPYFVYVSGDGRVLSSEDGYKGVESPWEDVQRVERIQTAEEFGPEKIVENHVNGLKQLSARVIERSGSGDQLVGLRDGTALLAGLIYDENNDAIEVYAESINAQGETVWRTACPLVPEESIAFRTAMQTEHGDILILLEHRKWIDSNTLEYKYDEQIVIGETGELKETIRLASIAQLTGQKKDLGEQMFGEPGHGGLLVSGSMGAKNTRVYAQLDEKGNVRFTLDFAELAGYAPYLNTTEQGYLLTAWNDASDMPILRLYDRQGNLIREGEYDERLKGLRINRVLEVEEGRYAVASNFMEDGRWELAFIGNDGKLISRHVKEFDSGAILIPSEIVSVKGKCMYACSHWCAQDVGGTGHMGLVICDEAGNLEEYHIRSMDEEYGNMVGGGTAGGPNVVRLGENKLMIAATPATDMRMDYTTEIAIIDIPQ